MGASDAPGFDLCKRFRIPCPRVDSLLERGDDVVLACEAFVVVGCRSNASSAGVVNGGPEPEARGGEKDFGLVVLRMAWAMLPGTVGIGIGGGGDVFLPRGWETTCGFGIGTGPGAVAAGPGVGAGPEAGARAGAVGIGEGDATSACAGAGTGGELAAGLLEAAAAAAALRAASYLSSSAATPFSSIFLNLSILGSKFSVLPLRARYMALSSSSSRMCFA